jgi:hypothetical protein
MRPSLKTLMQNPAACSASVSNHGFGVIVCSMACVRSYGGERPPRRLLHLRPPYREELIARSGPGRGRQRQ